MSENQRALVAVEKEGGRPQAVFTEVSDQDLPEGDVTVAVKYSSLNYKDALAITGRGRIVRRFPLVCGIDLAGIVESSDSARWKVGDEVIATGWGLSETHPGGYTQRQRVRSEWLVAKPPGLSLAQCMAIGTAGLTSMLCVMAIEDGGIHPAPGQVLVTGAAGGVGSIAIAVLANLGYDVTASTGRAEVHDYLRSLGASHIIERAELSETPPQPLGKATWAAAVDTVGGSTLATVLSRIAYRGVVAACGLAGGTDLGTTVMPFILRNVRLQGIDSVSCPTEVRETAWQRLTAVLPSDRLQAISSIEPMSALPDLAGRVLAGQVRGRVVVDVNA